MKFDKNPDSFISDYKALKKTKNYIYFMGILEGLCIFFIVLALDTDENNSMFFYSLLFVIQFFLLIDRLMELGTKEVTFEDKWQILDIPLTGIVLAYIVICLLVESSDYYIDFLNYNSEYRRMFGVIVVCKSFRFFDLVLLNKDINAYCDGVLKCCKYVLDLLFVIFIFFMIYSIIGITFYGGNINSGSPDLYMKIYDEELDENMMLFNFNDFYHSFLTLFMI